MTEIVVADTETTGTNVHEDRIVQAFVGLMDESGEWVERREWLIDPGIEIPAEAAAVHGYTTERIRSIGRPDTAEAVFEVVETITRWTIDRPLVAYNASFDISILECEARRHSIFWDREGLRVVDPLVLDKAKDRYRKGSRKLGDTARVYGIEVDETKTHAADYDCYLAGRIALKMLEKWKKSLEDMYDYQVEAAREQRSSLEEYFARSGKTEPDGSRIVIDPGWPIYDSVVQSNQ